MNRDVFYDSLKTVLIFLVVLGHLSSCCTNEHYLSLQTFIYIFHMPLFIFISGRFSQVREPKRYLKSILRLFETLILFHTLRYLFNNYPNGGEFSINDYLHPTWTMWYLLSLICWRLAVLLIYKIPQNKTFLIISCFLIGVFAGFLPVKTFLSVQRTLSFLPFFVMGYYSADIDIKKWANTHIKVFWPIITFAVISIVITVLPVDYLRKILNISQMNSNYYGDYMLYKMIGRFGLYIIATIMSVCVVRLLTANKTLTRLGGETLTVYIFHSWIISIISILMHKGFLILPFDTIWFTVVFSIIATVFLFIFSQFKISKWLLNPITTMIDTIRPHNRLKNS